MQQQTESRLTLVEFTGEKTKDGHRLARFRCACGNEAIVSHSRVKGGYTRSCGCLAAENKPNLSHGYKYSGTYRSWQSAKDRATNPRSKDFNRYGAVGIGFAERWLKFENFLEDMGERPEGLSLDRIDGTKGYEPGNCRWATLIQQARNTKAGYIWHVKGMVFETVYEAAAHFNVSVQSVCRWVRGSFDKRRGTHTPPREDCYAIRRY